MAAPRTLPRLAPRCDQGRAQRRIELAASRAACRFRFLGASRQQRRGRNLLRRVERLFRWAGAILDEHHSAPTTFSMQDFNPRVVKGFEMKLFIPSL